MGCSSDCSCWTVETSGDNHNTGRYNNRYSTGKSMTIDQNKIMMSQLEKCVCKIYQTEKNTGTGFMCKIPYQNKKLPILITNNHVLNEEKIKINQTIKISFYDDNTTKNIKIDNSRIKYTNPIKDITIIEIKKEDEINDFLDIDDTRTENEYKDESAYILQYKINCGGSFSIGNIKNITEGNIQHDCDTDNGSSGSPIISLKSQKVIGLHIGKNNNIRNIKYGIFIKNIIDEFKENKKYIGGEGDYYKGKMLNEKKNGIGIIYYYSGRIKYIGNFQNDYLIGIIKYIYKNGNCYIGESKNQLQNGKGILKDKDKDGRILYKGFFEEGKIQGFGMYYYYEKGNYYVGEWKNGLKHGFGIIYYDENKKTKYIGTFENDKYNGYGEELYKNGQYCYKGEYYNDKKHGNGLEYDENGKSSYKGEYQNGKKHGNGTEYYNDGKTPKYIGYYNNGNYDGKGVFYETDGTYYEGNFSNGKKHGDGKIYDKNNTLLKDVHFENGKEIIE